MCIQQTVETALLNRLAGFTPLLRIYKRLDIHRKVRFKRRNAYGIWNPDLAL
jgi:hypothetical protein